MKPAEMTPHERRDEVVSIFARAFPRLHRRVLPDNTDIDIPLDSSASCPELSRLLALLVFPLNDQRGRKRCCTSDKERACRDG